jgi:hypothetical protein
VLRFTVIAKTEVIGFGANLLKDVNRNGAIGQIGAKWSI